MRWLCLIQRVLVSAILFSGFSLTAYAQELPVPETLRFSSPSWPAALDADLYRPNGRGPFPTVLLIHGGGWNSGTRDAGYVKQIAEHLQRSGYAALAASYRLAPQARFPAQLDDMSEAIRWLKAHGAEHGLATEQIAVWGYSAGAHLASLISTQPQALPIVAVIAGGTPAELRVWPKSPMVKDLLGQARDEAPKLWAEASPVAQVNAQTPPHFLYHGRLDTLVAYSQAEKLKAALDAVDVPVTLYTRWFYGHILTAVAPGGSFSAATDFLASYLPPMPAQAAAPPLTPPVETSHAD
ncbi:acetyl esterase/lipase [Paraperlucidibaca baekdonensis]|uniref:Acetyl esterase/lipase n=1 Tax=Paraperlucidibaca baekdonensis TaxID=748120 RepID=A0A3E0H2C3_9GAMM|nr:alpha/beta hydrolase [Paraperlucidibaca baekdonensis]REH36649.1 acetyl esterase/lipase [Paraperlucidibaca baekdonensis]